MHKKLKAIAKETTHTENIKHHFQNSVAFETKDIVDFYEQFEKNITPTTINWRVYTLIQEGVLQRIGRGKFRLGESRKFVPEISSITKYVFKKLKAEFPYTNFCVWNTSVLNEFMQHQPNRFYILVETEKETTNAAFYFLRELKKSAFIEPTRDIFEKYILNEREAIVIKPLITEAPTQNINSVETATIEKILVDIFCDDVIFAAQQGAEKRTIFKEAFTKYTINQNKMLRYAGRRRKKEELNQFAKSTTNLWQQ